MNFLYADITPEENERRKQALADTLVEVLGDLLEDPEFIARYEAAPSTPTRRAGHTPRTTTPTPALPVAEEAALTC